MSIEQVYTLEVEGISNTIHNYTVDNYIKSYSKQLKNLHLPEDHDLILTIVDRLLDWYDISFNNILKSKFVSNKQEHKKTKQLLTRLKQELDIYQAD